MGTTDLTFCERTGLSCCSLARLWNGNGFADSRWAVWLSNVSLVSIHNVFAFRRAASERVSTRSMAKTTSTTFASATETLAEPQHSSNATCLPWVWWHPRVTSVRGMFL